MKRLIQFLIICGVIFMSIDCVLSGNSAVSYPKSHQYSDGEFKNKTPKAALGLRNSLKMLWDFTFNKPDDSVPKLPIPLERMTLAELEAANNNSFFRLGHSTILFKFHNDFWLTDPVFSQRASPVQWAGPKRFHQSPIELDALPPIKGVIISHDHYDHLDKETIEILAGRAERFFVPLGVGDRLIAWGIEESKVIQLDWWQSSQFAGVEVTATPANHFSGRGITDSNKTLWASWVIDSGDAKVFFSGDSGYFGGFKAIGENYGPFDMTFIETGAYNDMWADIHMQPVESLQAHIDLKGKWMMPIHNGTFDLAMHAWYEPLHRVSQLATEKNVRLTTPVMGQANDIHSPYPLDKWWEPLM